MKTDLEILQGARKRLTDPKNWHKGASVPDGNKVGDDCPHCLVATIHVEGGGAPIPGVLYGVLPEQFSHIGSFNDAETTTHDDVLRFLDEVIAAEVAR